MKHLTAIFAATLLIGCSLKLSGADDNPWKEQFRGFEIQRIPNEYTKYLVRAPNGTILLIETERASWGDPYKIISQVVIFGATQQGGK